MRVLARTSHVSDPETKVQKRTPNIRIIVIKTISTQTQ
jgi:hypothetical protein